MPRPPRAMIFSPSEVRFCIACNAACGVRFSVGSMNTPVRTTPTAKNGSDSGYGKSLRRSFGIDVTDLRDHVKPLASRAAQSTEFVETWSDKEVALRWLQIFPCRRMDEHQGDPTTNDVDALAKDTERLAICAVNACRMSRGLCALYPSPLLVLQIKTTSAPARFGEGDSKAMRIYDEATLMACCMYVDWNPVEPHGRVAENARFTGIYDRIAANSGKKVPSLGCTDEGD